MLQNLQQQEWAQQGAVGGEGKRHTPDRGSCQLAGAQKETRHNEWTGEEVVGWLMQAMQLQKILQFWQLLPALPAVQQKHPPTV